MFLHSAVSSPLDRSKRFILFLPWQTCSFRHQLDLSGKYSSHAAITRNDYSPTFPPLSIARYSFIQLSQLEHQWREPKCTNFEMVVKGDSNPGSLDCEYAALDISTGPAHFSDRRTSSDQYIFSFTGPYGPPRYMSGHQISNSGGPNDDKSQYVLFARAPVPHLGSFRAVLLLQRDASVTRVGIRHVNQTY